ncbi:outer membrane lipoprotein [Shewanella sedimentimangrovi]|uniref:Glycine zipper 2TM domain-containing protein n=1 Tax=Shewanella sedimentimangrovi TaxID=2814293 RepID=A0ABX7QW66_9GAMM|nr:glycine zipper 2TM domain-containing protein [Shewanella sedimentimangrovi]
MWKPVLFGLMLVLMPVTSALAEYERNQAVPVEKVVYGEVLSVRQISESQLVEDRNRGWRTFGGALLGGVIGHQFGSGTGRDVATVLGALIGGGVANQSGGAYYRQYRLLELMIRQEDDSQIMVIQDADPGMPLKAGDQVRVVYLVGSVRVDLAM